MSLAKAILVPVSAGAAGALVVIAGLAWYLRDVMR
jgi:hypothetical protein